MVSNLPPSSDPPPVPIGGTSASKHKSEATKAPAVTEVSKSALSAQPETSEPANLKDKVMPVQSSTVPKHINPYDIELSDDEELGAALEKLPQEIEIPSDNPFFNSKVRVFEDKYPGKLPLINGMRETEWIQASKWISELNDTGKIGSLELHGDDAFKEELIKSLILLCESSLGRELIGKIIQLEHPCCIFQKEDFTTAAMMVPHHPEAVITVKVGEKEGKIPNWRDIDVHQWNFNVIVNPLITTQIYVGSDEKRTLASMPFHVLLAHELMHALHASIDPSAFFTRLEEDDATNYDNVEERLTITGWKTPIPRERAHLVSDPGKDAEEEDWTQWVVENNSAWDPMSENGLRSVVSLYKRDGHDGSLKLKNPDLSQLKPELAEVLFKVCVKTGDVKGMEELLDHGWMNRVPNAEHVLVSAASEAAQWGQLQSLEKLLFLGVKPNETNFSGQTLLHLSAFGGHPALVDKLINVYQLDPNKQDRILQTPLVLATAGFLQFKGTKREAKRAGYEAVISQLLKQKGAAEASILDTNSALGMLLADGEVQLAQLFLTQGARLAGPAEKIGFLVLLLNASPVSITPEAKEFIVKNRLLETLSMDSETIIRLVGTAILNDREINVTEAENLGMNLDLSKLDAPFRESLLANLIHNDKNRALDFVLKLKLDLVSPLSNGQTPLEYARSIGASKVAEDLSTK